MLTFDKPNASIDLIVFTIKDLELLTLIGKRAISPFKGGWSLIGGFVDVTKDKNILATAKRKLHEKTNVKSGYFEQIGFYGDQSRDPRGWTITNVYMVLVPFHKIDLISGSGISELKWQSTKTAAKKLSSFDHKQIYTDGLERLKNKSLYTSLPFHLMPPKFSLRDLKKTFELVSNIKIDQKSFNRRIDDCGNLTKLDEVEQSVGRPSALYSIKDSKYTHYFSRSLRS